MKRPKSSASAKARQSLGSSASVSRSTVGPKTTDVSSGKRTLTGSGPRTGLQQPPGSGDVHQPPVTHRMATVPPRDPQGTGKFAPHSLKEEQPPGQVPQWVIPLPGESKDEWSDRIYLDWCRYQVEQGFGDDLVALKRHELAAKQLWPVRQELDITARQDDWLRHLTDEELLVLKGLRDRALGRNVAIPVTSDCISDEVVAEGDGHE